MYALLFNYVPKDSAKLIMNYALIIMNYFHEPFPASVYHSIKNTYRHGSTHQF